MQGTHRSDFWINGQSMVTEKALGIYINKYEHRKKLVILSYPWRTGKMLITARMGI